MSMLFRSKAVAEGAALWHLQKTVAARAARFSYGIKWRVKYDQDNTHHVGRKVTHDPPGPRIHDVWKAVTQKVSSFWLVWGWFRHGLTHSAAVQGEVVGTNELRRLEDIRSSYSTPTPNLTEFSTKVYARTSHGDQEPYFLKTKSGMSASDHLYRHMIMTIILTGELDPQFCLACTVTADLSNLQNSLARCEGPDGPFWALHYDVGLFFGSTELTAVILWKDSQVRSILAFWGTRTVG